MSTNAYVNMPKFFVEQAAKSSGNYMVKTVHLMQSIVLMIFSV